jgi:cytochrome oxidase assembly protein ShyY1
VLTALVTDDGSTIVVNRGFVRLGTDVPAAPSGRFDVLGRVRVPQERRTGELTDNAEGPVEEVRRIDLDQLAAQLPGDLPPVYLDLVDSRPEGAPTDPVPVPAPTLDEGPHLSYAIQWFIFATCVLIGWVLAVRRSLATRRRAVTRNGETGDVRDEPDERTSSGSPTSDDVASATTPT